VWLVRMRVVLDAIYALAFVGFDCVVWSAGAKTPNLYGAIQAGTCKCIGVLGVYRDGHDIVRVALEGSDELESILEIPAFDEHVIGRSEDEGLSRMHNYGSNVI